MPDDCFITIVAVESLPNERKQQSFTTFIFMSIPQLTQPNKFFMSLHQFYCIPKQISVRVETNAHTNK